ncbi:MAG: hypothetical protein ACRENG_30435 [bacterium]
MDALARENDQKTKENDQKNKAEKFLWYFEDRLRLIQTIGAGKDQIRFNLYPLAEYLAGLHVVESTGGNAQAWQRFLNRANHLAQTSHPIKDFLLAVRDCCLAKSTKVKVPNFVLDELGKLAGLGLHTS